MPSFFEKLLLGDSAAIIAFYQKYQSKLLRFVKQKLEREEDAQEIVNDVFLEAIDSLPLLKKEENLQAWLYKIAHNKMVDFYRKRKIKSVLLSQVPFMDFFEEIHQPEFIYEKDRVRQTIEQTLLDLTPKNQKILRMHYEENISVKDVAKQLHLSFKATESLLFRARKSFQKAYKQTL